LAGSRLTVAIRRHALYKGSLSLLHAYIMWRSHRSAWAATAPATLSFGETAKKGASCGAAHSYLFQKHEIDMSRPESTLQSLMNLLGRIEKDNDASDFTPEQPVEE
jgi:hypothetical protein